MLENKLTEVEEMYDRERALTVIEDAVAGYRAKSGWNKR